MQKFSKIKIKNILSLIVMLFGIILIIIYLPRWIFCVLMGGALIIAGIDLYLDKL
jgi:uncharacterized membrane protein